MLNILVAFILEIDSENITVESVAQWLLNRKIDPRVFYIQNLPVGSRLTIIVELDNFVAGCSARRLRKLKGVSRLDYLVPREYNFRSVPPAVVDSLKETL